MSGKSKEYVERRIVLEDIEVVRLTGVGERNIHLLRQSFPGKIIVRGNQVLISGKEEDVQRMEEVIETLVRRVKRRGYVLEDDVQEILGTSTAQKPPKSLEIVTPRRRIYPRSPNQEEYLRAIIENHVVVAIGPAGTGKTYLAVAMAVKYLLEKRVEKIVLTRPAVEAGESLGFLPGDFQEKINPYLTPLYDALYSMLHPDQVRRLIETRVIEVAPLAYMRGRTLQDAFLILDEAQNTRSVQMKMFLTRIGPRTKVVITGDITQIDLPKEDSSGLVDIQSILKNIPGIRFIYFTTEDVVRHELVRKIVEAYERKERAQLQKEQREKVPETEHTAG